MRTAANSSNKKRTGLARMQFAQLLRRNLFAFKFQIKALAANHTEVTGTHSHFAYSFNQNFRINILLFQHYLKCQSEQAVTGKHCHSFTKNLMIGQTAAAIIIVIHARQVIVNQRIGVNHFQTASHGQIIVALAAHSLCRSHQQNRTNAFTACHQAVFHSFIYLGNTLFGNSVLQIVFYQFLLVSIISFKIHYFTSKSWNVSNL